MSVADPDRQAAGLNDRDELNRLIRDRDLRIVYQTIFDLREGIPIGAEALTRPPAGSALNNPGLLFEAAERHEQLWELESIARPLALQGVRNWSPNQYLFLNVTPIVFADPRFVETLIDETDHLAGIGRNRVVIELTERSEHGVVGRLAEQFEHLRSAGFLLAIDDVGAGTSGLNRIMRLRPHWLKLDRELVSSIDTDPFKQNLIRFFVHFARLSNIRLLAEGIEREEELAALIEMGVGYGQGFLLRKPAPAGIDVDPVWTKRIGIIRRRTEANRFVDPREIRVGTLAVPLTTFPSSESLGTARRLIQHLCDVPGLALTDGAAIVGYTSLPHLTKVGDDVVEETPIIRFSERGWLVVDPDTTVAEAIELATNRSDDELMAPLLVASEDVVGLLPMRALLRAASRIQPDGRDHRSPITGLPDRVQVDAQLRYRIQSSDPAAIAFVDLRHFDPYNQAFGHPMGDEMLRHLAGLLASHFPSDGGDFVGHRVDDHFVVVSARPEFECVLWDVCAAFDDQRGRFFTANDLERRAFTYEDNGRDRECPLTAVRAILVPSPFRPGVAPGHIHTWAAGLKNERDHEVTPGNSGVILKPLLRASA